MDVIKQAIQKIYPTEKLEVPSEEVLSPYLCSFTPEEISSQGKHIAEKIESFQNKNCTPLITSLEREKRALLWQYRQSFKLSQNYPLLENYQTSLEEETLFISPEQESAQEEFISKIKEVEELLRSAENLLKAWDMALEVRQLHYHAYFEQAEGLLLEAEDILSLELSKVGPQLYSMNAFLLANRARLVLQAKHEGIQISLKPSDTQNLLNMAKFWSEEVSSTNVLKDSLITFFKEDEKSALLYEDQTAPTWARGFLNG